MRFLAATLGRLIFCVGLMVTVVGCVLGSISGGSSGGSTMFGVTLIILGGAIYWRASTKICPQCSARIKHNAITCKGCGAATR